MAYRSWLDIYPGAEKVRPTRTRVRGTLPPLPPGYIPGISSPFASFRQPTYESYEEAVAPTISEILEDLTREFRGRPVSYTTDPETGRVIATKTMPRMERPRELDYAPSRIRGLFAEPSQLADDTRPWHEQPPRSMAFWQQGEQAAGPKPLTATWTLPRGALTGPHFNVRQPPPGSAERGTALSRGLRDTGQTLAYLNPQTFWPSSAFDLPYREGAYGREPIFGSVTDYTKGRLYAPRGFQSYGQLFGRFPAGLKSVPGGEYSKLRPFRGMTPLSTIFRRR